MGDDDPEDRSRRKVKTLPRKDPRMDVRELMDLHLEMGARANLGSQAGLAGLGTHYRLPIAAHPKFFKSLGTLTQRPTVKTAMLMNF